MGIFDNKEEQKKELCFQQLIYSKDEEGHKILNPHTFSTEHVLIPSDSDENQAEIENRWRVKFFTEKTEKYFRNIFTDIYNEEESKAKEASKTVNLSSVRTRFQETIQNEITETVFVEQIPGQKVPSLNAKGYDNEPTSTPTTTMKEAVNILTNQPSTVTTTNENPFINAIKKGIDSIKRFFETKEKSSNTEFGGGRIASQILKKQFLNHLLQLLLLHQNPKSLPPLKRPILKRSSS